MKQLRLVFVFLFALLVVGTAGPADPPKDQPDPAKGIEVKVADLEDFVAKTKMLNVSNITMKETPSEDENLKGMATFEVKANVKNRTDNQVHFIVMIVGLSADKKVLWSLTPRGSVGGGDQQVQADDHLIPEGAKKATQFVWIRVVNY
jgi:hypothetical protein